MFKYEATITNKLLTDNDQTQRPEPLDQVCRRLLRRRCNLQDTLMGPRRSKLLSRNFDACSCALLLDAIQWRSGEDADQLEQPSAA